MAQGKAQAFSYAEMDWPLREDLIYNKYMARKRETHLRAIGIL